jgi:hypothetical protein
MNPTWGAAAVLVLALLALTRPWITSQQAIVAVTSAALAARVQQNTSSATSVWDSSKESVVARPRKSSNSRSELSSGATQEPEVLVPPDEQKAFAQFVARVAGQDAMAAAVVSQAPDKTVPRNTALPQVSSVDVAQLERVDRDDSDEIDGSE